MSAWIATSCDRATACQPLAVSLVKVAVASSVPVAVHRCASCGPTFLRTLVESDTGDEARNVRLELHAELDVAGVVDRDRSSACGRCEQVLGASAGPTVRKPGPYGPPRPSEMVYVKLAMPDIRCSA